MSENSFFIRRKNLVLKSFASIVLLFFAFKLSAQSIPDFSGVWIQDVTKSDDFYKAFDVKCTISQTSQSFNVKTTFSDKSGKEMVTRESTFTLDGKVITDSEGAKKSGKWIPGEKTFMTSDTKDYGGDVVGVKAAWSISDNGQVLTLKTSDIRPDSKTVTQIFNKQKK